MNKPFYEIVDHTADIGILVRAKNLPELYINAALAFFDLMAGLENIKPNEMIPISVEATDLENLMVNWLGELLYLFDSDGWLLVDFQLELKHMRIIATGKGEKYDPTKHEIRYYIKAITYHMLEVKQDKDEWVARVIFDI